jgi:NDP-sugar pyrophosphorylase family protein
MANWRPLSADEIHILEQNHCQAEDWARVEVGQEFDASRIRSTSFSGNIQLGSNTGYMTINHIKIHSGIHNSHIKDCRIGDNVHISNVTGGLVNYHVADEVVIQDVYVLGAEPGTKFGEGTLVNVMNEAGGRPVNLCRELNAQIAYLQAIPKHAQTFQHQLQNVMQHTSDIPSAGIIGHGARIKRCQILRNILIGEHAVIEGVSELVNGTVNSCKEHPTRIGMDVIMKHFIVAEGAEICDGAILDHVYVGQGAKIGKQFSAEHSLFFANCDGFHSEANALFAGPYTVTHHRSSLLIAAMFSFYNAGSGTNLSNHMYKLGPVHQGILERGCKTGSSSYLLLESHIPAFSIITGKHMSNISIPDFPFSHLAEENGKSMLIPGKNLFSVGTLRDAEKWPARDRRKASLKRDMIIFDVFSPFTVEKMRSGKKILQTLYKETPKEQDVVSVGGIQIRRLLLRKGIKYYTLAINRYLLGTIIEHLQQKWMEDQNLKHVLGSFECEPVLQHPQQWLDVAGLLAPRERIETLIEDLAQERIGSIQALDAALRTIYHQYRKYEWEYICHAFEKEYNMTLGDLSGPALLNYIDLWSEAASSLNALTLADARIEYGEFSKIGYGLNMDTEQRDQDFERVRGSEDKQPVIQQLVQEAETIKTRTNKIKSALKNIT